MLVPSGNRPTCEIHFTTKIVFVKNFTKEILFSVAKSFRQLDLRFSRKFGFCFGTEFAARIFNEFRKVGTEFATPARTRGT